MNLKLRHISIIISITIVLAEIIGKKFFDLSIMSAGTNILGYANSDVDNFVKQNIDKSNMSTLNCPEEVLLAEKLIEMHPWSEMVRFAKTGGEANSIAVRIARASSGKDGIAICGYHGWHDWYLASNIGDNDNLAIAGYILSLILTKLSI